MCLGDGGAGTFEVLEVSEDVHGEDVVISDLYISTVSLHFRVDENITSSPSPPFVAAWALCATHLTKAGSAMAMSGGEAASLPLGDSTGNHGRYHCYEDVPVMIKSLHLDRRGRWMDDGL